MIHSIHSRTLGRIIVAIGLPVLMSACASDGAPRDNEAIAQDDPRRGEKVDRICFNRNIDRFSDARKNSVVVETSPSRQYLLEVRGICPQLRRAQRLAIDSTLSCVTRNDVLLVSENIFSDKDSGFGPDRCFISGMYKWDKNAEAEEKEQEDEE